MRGPAGVEDRADGGGARDVVREHEEAVLARDDAQPVTLAERVEYVVLRLRGLAPGPLEVVVVGCSVFRIRPEAPDDGGLAVLDEGAWSAFRELCMHISKVNSRKIV